MVCICIFLLLTSQRHDFLKWCRFDQRYQNTNKTLQPNTPYKLKCFSSPLKGSKCGFSWLPSFPTPFLLSLPPSERSTWREHANTNVTTVPKKLLTKNIKKSINHQLPLQKQPPNYCHLTVCLLQPILGAILTFMCDTEENIMCFYVLWLFEQLYNPAPLVVSPALKGCS